MPPVPAFSEFYFKFSEMFYLNRFVFAQLPGYCRKGLHKYHINIAARYPKSVGHLLREHLAGDGCYRVEGSGCFEFFFGSVFSRRDLQL